MLQDRVPEMKQLTLRSESEIMAAVLQIQQDLLQELQNGNGSGCRLRWAVERASVDEAVVEAARPELPATPPVPPPLAQLGVTHAVPGTSVEANVPTSQFPPPPSRQSPTVPPARPELPPAAHVPVAEAPPMVQLSATPPVPPALARSPFVEDF